jgi:hypothetical protein
VPPSSTGRLSCVATVTSPGVAPCPPGPTGSRGPAAASWERYDKRAQDWVRTDPPPRHSGVLYDSTSYTHLAVLNGLARQPYLRPDGSLMATAGYDAATRMFGVFDQRAFSIPEHPTRADAEAALALLDELLGEFSFAGEADRAAALTAILAAAIRPSLPVAPMFHVRAHMISSGSRIFANSSLPSLPPSAAIPPPFRATMRSAASCCWPSCCAARRLSSSTT